jgi:SAM-dependent methyltransferase
MFSDVYASWKQLQMQKYGGIFQILGDDFFCPGLILDIGAGSGFLEEFMAQKGIDNSSFNIIALEPDIAMIMQAASRRDFVQGSASNMPFKPGSFDFAFCIDSIHLFDPDFSPLKKGAKIVATLFCNDTNYMEKRQIILSKLSDFDVISEHEIGGKEKEIMIMAKKR